MNPASLLQARRVLIVAPRWVGDAIMATPCFAAIHAALPQARIALLCKPSLRPLFDGASWFDTVLDDTSMKSIGEAWKTAGRLRAGEFDAAILLPNSLRSALVAWRAGIPRRIGYARNLRSMLLTDAIPVTCGRGKHDPVFMGEYYARLWDAMSIPGARGSMQLPLTPAADARADALWKEAGFGEDEPVIALNPGAMYGSAKRWEESAFAAAGDALAERVKARILVLAGPGEEAIAWDIVNRMKHPAMAFDPAQVPLDVLKSLVRRLRLLVSTDSGPRHIAVAFGVPVVTIYGPTHIGWSHGGYAKAVNVSVPVPCGPCMKRVCPTDHRCMRLITPDVVVSAAERLLAGELATAGGAA